MPKLLPHSLSAPESEIDTSIGSRKLSSLESEVWRNEWTVAVFDPVEQHIVPLEKSSLPVERHVCTH